MFPGTFPDEPMTVWAKDFFPVVPAGVSGISCSPDGFAVIQGGGGMMAQTDISATSFRGKNTRPHVFPVPDFPVWGKKAGANQ